MYQLPELLNYPVTHAFSTRNQGNMSFNWGETKEVSTNRETFLENLKINSADCVTTELLHGNTIIRVTKKDTNFGVLKKNYLLQSDGLITNEKGLHLFHVVADCLSVLFYDPIHQAIGLAHAGRQSTAQKITSKMIAKMQENFKTKPQDLVVGLGPSIHQCCYGLATTELAYTPEWQPFLRQEKDGLIHINLVGENLYELTDAGVEQENIFISEHCTAHSDKFFSHYRDQSQKKPEARFMSVIGLKK